MILINRINLIISLLSNFKDYKISKFTLHFFVIKKKKIYFLESVNMIK